ncbi:MAG: hypothetical protein KAW56_14315 [Candidatus Marinimicrobia bacterium]|nr:hypothetical protein [candidate division WOR-3 bacterium]MCK4448242.1 hypothetical protein [Candidatus Neomarinimicrobiota bacterium]
MRKLAKVNNNLIEIKNVEELKESVVSTGKSLGPFKPKIFQLYELKKKYPDLFGYLHETKDLRERMSSPEWREKLSFNYNIIYPSKELKLKLEEIPLKALETKSCVEISEIKNIPLHWVLKYKSLFLYITSWSNCGLIRIEKSKINFQRLEQTCRLACKQWQSSLVDCIPPRGY